MAHRTLRSDLAAFSSRVHVTWAGFPAWVAGAVTAVQAAAVTILGVLALTLVTVAAAPTSDGSVAVNWNAASVVGVKLWLFGFGVPMTSDDVTLSLLPVGLTVLSGVVTALFARRFAAPTFGSALAAGAAFGGIVATTAAAVGVSAVGVATGAAWAGAVGVFGVIAGVRRARGIWVLPVGNVPVFTRNIARLSGSMTAAIFALGAVALCAWMVVGWSDIRAAIGALNLDPVGGVVLAVGELAYVPTLVAWDVAWLSGPGFAVGEGTRYAPSELSTAPLPLIPLLGALPQAAGGPLVWAPLTIVAVGALVRTAGLRWSKAASSVRVSLAQAPVTALVVGLIMEISSGSAGASHLASVGPEPFTVGLVVAGELTAGVLIVDMWRWWRARTQRPVRVRLANSMGSGRESRMGVESARRPRVNGTSHPTRRGGPAEPARTPQGNSSAHSR